MNNEQRLRTPYCIMKGEDIYRFQTTMTVQDWRQWHRVNQQGQSSRTNNEYQSSPPPAFLGTGRSVSALPSQAALEVLGSQKWVGLGEVGVDAPPPPSDSPRQSPATRPPLFMLMGQLWRWATRPGLCLLGPTENLCQLEREQPPMCNTASQSTVSSLHPRKRHRSVTPVTMATTGVWLLFVFSGLGNVWRWCVWRVEGRE